MNFEATVQTVQSPMSQINEINPPLPTQVIFRVRPFQPDNEEKRLKR